MTARSPAVPERSTVSSPIPPSLDHNDLHPWNIFSDAEGRRARFYDWGDSVVAHPFASLLVALGFVRYQLKVPANDERVERVRAAYLAEFADLASRAELIHTAELACHVAKVARVLTWSRALAALGFDAGASSRERRCAGSRCYWILRPWAWAAEPRQTAPLKLQSHAGVLSDDVISRSLTGGRMLVNFRYIGAHPLCIQLPVMSRRASRRRDARRIPPLADALRGRCPSSRALGSGLWRGQRARCGPGCLRRLVPTTARPRASALLVSQDGSPGRPCIGWRDEAASAAGSPSRRAGGGPIPERASMFSVSDGESARFCSSEALGQSPQALAVFDAQGRLRSCSDGFRRSIASLRDAELADADYARVLEHVRRFIGPRAGDESFSALGFEREVDVDFALDGGRSMRWSQRPLPSGGLFVLFLDRTDDERRLRELRDAVRDARAAHQASLALLRALSRELCSQLNGVLGFIQLMLRERREPLSERNQARATEASRGGKTLIRSLLAADELARVGLDPQAPPLDDVDVLALVDGVRSALVPLAYRAGVALHVVCDYTSSPPSVRAARGHLRQILMHLGSNAIAYNRPDGSVAFKLSAPRPGVVRINVIDTGAGIEREHHAKLFQHFYRAGRTSGEGAGIGLVIVQRLAEVMGGRVGFESVHGHGSEFWVDLPSSEPAADAG